VCRRSLRRLFQGGRRCGPPGWPAAGAGRHGDDFRHRHGGRGGGLIIARRQRRQACSHLLELLRPAMAGFRGLERAWKGAGLSGSDSPPESLGVRGGPGFAHSLIGTECAHGVRRLEKWRDRSLLLRRRVCAECRHIIIMGIIFRPNSGNLYGRLLKEIWTVVSTTSCTLLSQLRA
jgi:hypothetical protein